MIDDSMQRLRASNPVPSEIAPPPIDEVLRRIAAETHPPRARRAPGAWPRLAHALVPGLAVVAAIAVALGAILILSGRTHPVVRPGGPPSTVSAPTVSTPRPPVKLPAHGMRGGLELLSANASPSGVALISFQQCRPCAPPAVGNGAFHNWLATSNDHGQTWQVQGTEWLLQDPTFAGTHDGWSEGSAASDHVYVTHDGGLEWDRASVPVSASSGGAISIAGGVVWRAGDCAHTPCPTAIERGSAAGRTLAPTAAQPAPANQDSEIRAASATTAYVESIAAQGDAEDFVTRDGGHSWQRISTICRSDVSTGLEVGDANALWEVCPLRGAHRTALARSHDGGRHWHAYPEPAGGILTRLWPVSDRIAWALNRQGEVIRTADGGATWQTVWSQASVPPTLRGQVADLSAQDAQSAEVVLEVRAAKTRHRPAHFNLVAYFTSDGGRVWQPSVVALPAG